MGGSGMGKSTLLYDILTQLIMEGAGFALLDPHGELYEQLLAFLSYTDYRASDVRLIDATKREITATVNPFTSEQAPDAIETKAQILTDLTLQVWGKDSEAVRAEKILYVLYVALLEQRRPLSDIFDVLENPGVIRNLFARTEWEQLRGKSYLDSVTTRLKPLAHERLRALTNPNQAIDFSRLLNENILLANLSRSDIMGDKECRTLAAFLVAEIWSAAFSRRQRHPSFYLVIDEFKILATEELANVLAQAQKFGLHLIFLHQTEQQLPTYMKDAIGNVSCFIHFVGKGEVVVNGWGSGVNQTFIEPEPEIYANESLDAATERYRKSVTIRPIEVSHPPLLLEAIVDEKPTAALSVPLMLPASPPPKTERRQSDIVLEIPSLESYRGGQHHQSLQRQIKQMAETYKFQADIEKATDSGEGFVDVSLEKDGVRIAVEVSVTTPATWEAKNVLKCLKAGYDHVIVVSSQAQAIPALTAKIKTVVPVIEQHKIKIVTLDGFFRFLKQMFARVNLSAGKPGKLAGPLLTLQEAAEFFGRSTSTVYRWANEGRVPYIRIGRNYQFDREVLVLLGRQNLSGKRKTAVNLDPVKIEKAKPKGKKQQDARYRKMLKLD
jgi:excisionase family DNA binding protein